MSWHRSDAPPSFAPVPVVHPSGVAPKAVRRMISSPTIDFELLTRPIEGPSPAGQDLRADPSSLSPYYQIKDARAAARAAERSGAPTDTSDYAGADEWRKVLRLAPDILATKAKDLEIVAWFTEALLREHGFAGLRDGFRLLRELVEKYWDGLYPMPDEDGIATRVAPLAGLNGGDSEGTLAVPLALAPITGDGEFGRFNLWRYGKVRELAKITDPNEIAAAIEAGTPTMEQFEATVRGSDPNFLRCLVGDVEASLEHFIAATALLDAKCGADSPPSSTIRSTLQEAKQTITHVVREIAHVPLDGEEVAAAEKGDGAAGDGAPGAVPVAAGASGAIRNREDAFRLLTKVADYFRASEPHSPLPSMLEQAVRWGRLPLAQLIEELIPDPSARDHFSLLTGLRGKPQSTESQ